MSENGIREAEQRVREMNRVTRQYAEQGNRYLQNIRTPPHSSTQQQPPRNVQRAARFEPAVKAEPQSGQGGTAQNNSSQNVAPNTQSNNNHNLYNKEIHNNVPMLPDLKIDNEKLMILLLMYLLMREKADIKLILALGYLLL